MSIRDRPQSKLTKRDCPTTDLFIASQPRALMRRIHNMKHATTLPHATKGGYTQLKANPSGKVKSSVGRGSRTCP